MAQKATILLIEDNQEIAEPLVFGLQQEGYVVHHATTGEEGLELARMHHPDLILLDIMLPGMDGFDVCRRLRATSGTPILMLTARSQELDRAAREFDLLLYLMTHAGQALHRQQILDAVWGEDWVGDPRTLDVHIHWLREKLGDHSSNPRYIQTVRGYGYRFIAPGEHATTTDTTH